MSRVAVEDEHDVLRVSQLCLEEGRRLGCSDQKRAVLDCIVRELAWNLVRHAGGGEIRLGRVAGGGDEREGVCVESLDQGPGVRALGRPGRPGAESLGIGLDVVHRLCDEFTLTTRPGSTSIRAVLWWR